MRDIRECERMYVCICNGLNERRVNEALSGGAGTVGKIYKHCGCAPRCGKCIPVMRDMLDRHEPAEIAPESALA